MLGLDFLIWLLVVVGAVVIVGIILKQLGVVIPQWVINIFWVVLAICVGVLALKIISRL